MPRPSCACYFSTAGLRIVTEEVGSCLIAVVGKVDVGKAMMVGADCFRGGINRHGEN